MASSSGSSRKVKQSSVCGGGCARRWVAVWAPPLHLLERDANATALPPNLDFSATLLCTPSCNAQLADFGFSKDTNQHSAPNSRVGTPAYLAPEVVKLQLGQKYDGQVSERKEYVLPGLVVVSTGVQLPHFALHCRKLYIHCPAGLGAHL